MCSPPGVDGSSLSTAAHRQRAGRGEAVSQQKRRGGADGGEGESQEDALRRVIIIPVAQIISLDIKICFLHSLRDILK